MMNHWHKPGKGYWMCLYWDVVRERDGWHVYFLYHSSGERIRPTFRTAREAMRYVDELVD